MWFSLLIEVVVCSISTLRRACRCVCCVGYQTIIRRLNLSQMASPTLNPFIEKHEAGVRPAGHSWASSVPVSASAKPQVMRDDVVIPGTLRSSGRPPSSTFLALQKAVLCLNDEYLHQLLTVGVAGTALFVVRTLRAVRIRLLLLCVTAFFVFGHFIGSFSVMHCNVFLSCLIRWPLV